MSGLVNVMSCAPARQFPLTITRSSASRSYDRWFSGLVGFRSFWLTGFSIALGALAWPHTARRSAGFWSVGFVVSAFPLLGHVPVVSARLGFRISALVVYDQLAPKITRHPTREDIRAWCRHKDLAVEHLDLCTGKTVGAPTRLTVLRLVYRTWILELVEFCWRLPTSLKMNSKQGNVLLRNCERGHYPETLARVPKKGFNMPLASWFRKDIFRLRLRCVSRS